MKDFRIGDRITVINNYSSFPIFPEMNLGGVPGVIETEGDENFEVIVRIELKDIPTSTIIPTAAKLRGWLRWGFYYKELCSVNRIKGGLEIEPQVSERPRDI